jgi:hypothetical protein
VGELMRIFIQPPNPNVALDDMAIRVCEILRLSLISSASVGEIFNNQAVVLVAPHDTQLAIAVLKRAGIEGIAAE